MKLLRRSARHRSRNRNRASVRKRGAWNVSEWSALAIALLLLLTTGTVGDSYAMFTAEGNMSQNKFHTLTVGAPAGLTAEVQGADVELRWGSGVNGTSYTVYGANPDATGQCTEAQFLPLADVAGLTYVDPVTVRDASHGTLYCYQVVTKRGPWRSLQNNPTASVQFGFFVTSVHFIKAGSIGRCNGTNKQQYGHPDKLQCGDQFVITFDHPVQSDTGPRNTDTVCAVGTSGQINLGSTTENGSCSIGEGLALGMLVGGQTTRANGRFDATYAWSGDNTVLTVTLGELKNGSEYPTFIPAGWRFVPTTDVNKLRSANGNSRVCDNGERCQPYLTYSSSLLHLMMLLDELPVEDEEVGYETTPDPTSEGNSEIEHIDDSAEQEQSSDAELDGQPDDEPVDEPGDLLDDQPGPAPEEDVDELNELSTE